MAASLQYLSNLFSIVSLSTLSPLSTLYAFYLVSQSSPNPSSFWRSTQQRNHREWQCWGQSLSIPMEGFGFEVEEVEELQCCLVWKSNLMSFWMLSNPEAASQTDHILFNFRTHIVVSVTHHGARRLQPVVLVVLCSYPPRRCRLCSLVICVLWSLQLYMVCYFVLLFFVFCYDLSSLLALSFVLLIVG